jgi:hypothetical protein
MALENKRIEITDRVIGKLAEDKMELYVENEPIGYMKYSNPGNSFELKSGYNAEGNRIYQDVVITTGSDEKYVDCDEENGWC